MLFDDISKEDKTKAKGVVRVLFETHKGLSMIILFEMLLDFTIRFDKNDFNYLNRDFKYSIQSSLRKLAKKSYIIKVDKIRTRNLYEIPANMFPDVLILFKHRLFKILDYYEENNLSVPVDIVLVFKIVDRLSFCSVRDILHYRVMASLKMLDEDAFDVFAIERLDFLKANYDL